MELIWIAIFVFAICVALVVFIFQMPAEKFRKKKRPVVPAPVKEVDWQSVAARSEKNNATLANEIEALKKERKSFIEQLADHKKTIDEQLEQLAREKAWREKETQMVAKVKNLDHELKDELRKVQQMLDEEHSLKLKVDVELQEAKITISRLKEEVRSLTVKTLAIEKQADATNKELKELRYTNTELKKQKEDVKWIAKSDYDQVVMKLKKTESELARLTRDQQPEPQAKPVTNTLNENPASEAQSLMKGSPSKSFDPQGEAMGATGPSAENIGPQAASPEEADLKDVSNLNEQSDRDASKENPKDQTDKLEGDRTK